MKKKRVATLVVEPPLSSSKVTRSTEDFKRDLVRLVTDEKYTFQAAATAGGVSQKSLRDLHAQFAPQPVPCDEHASLEELRAENQRLPQ